MYRLLGHHFIISANIPQIHVPPSSYQLFWNRAKLFNLLSNLSTTGTIYYREVNCCYILIYNISSKSIFLFYISLPYFILKNNIKINWRENVKIWREGNENVLDRFLFDIFSWLHTPVWTCVKCKPIPLAHLSRMVTHTSGFPFESLNYSLKWKRKLLPKVPSYCTK